MLEPSWDYFPETAAVLPKLPVVLVRLEEKLLKQKTKTDVVSLRSLDIDTLVRTVSNTV